jgi:hypothetical protein
LRPVALHAARQSPTLRLSVFSVDSNEKGARVAPDALETRSLRANYLCIASEAAAAASEAAPAAAAAASVEAAEAAPAASEAAPAASPAASEAVTAASVAVSAASEAASAASVDSEPFEQAERPRTVAAATAARTILRMYGILEQRVDQARHKAGPKAYCESRLRASINQLGAWMQASSRLCRIKRTLPGVDPKPRLCRGCDLNRYFPPISRHKAALFGRADGPAESREGGLSRSLLSR